MMSSIFGVVVFLAFIAFGIAQLTVGYIGIEHELSSVWAWIALIVALGFRFTLPISIGAFYGAMNVLGWHWALAAIFVAPGLLLVIPGLLASILSMRNR